MSNILSRLAALENRPGSRIPHFTVETADGTTMTAHGYGLLTVDDAVRACYDPAQPCAGEVVGLFVALHPEVEVIPDG